jgi:mRNA interferase MazF
VTRAQLPSRGEIWLVDLDPTRGREQRGTRPAVIVSADVFNHGPADLLIVCPLTKVSRSIPSHVPIARLDSGLDHDSYIICEQVRCLSRERAERSIGRASASTMEEVASYLRIVLDI